MKQVKKKYTMIAVTYVREDTNGKKERSGVKKKRNRLQKR